jgi:biotin transport system substrate-specific component
MEVGLNTTRVLPENGRAALPTMLRTAAILLIGSAIITVGAKISVPVWPVPVTLQTMAVAMIAAFAGARLGTAIVVTYLLQGLAGLPVFASGGGAAYIFGPTGGFLLAYLPMAMLIGRAADMGWKARPLLLFLTMVVADALVFSVGFLWLLALAGSAGWIDQSAPLASAWRGAVEPFLLWDALKMALAAALCCFIPMQRRKR